MALSFLRFLTRQDPGDPADIGVSARVAIYDSPGASPRIIDVDASDPSDMIGNLSAVVYEECRKNGGRIPFTVIKEISENLIHADFCDCIVTVSADGSKVAFSDHGPGIPDKRKAMLPGYSTATSQHRRFIRGVGSGLPIASEAIAILGGNIDLDDNLSSGAVVTVSLPPSDLIGRGESHPKAKERTHRAPKAVGTDSSNRSDTQQPSVAEANLATAKEMVRSSLSDRQKRILILAAELREIGPSAASRELGISLSTVFRDLVALEEIDLLEAVGGGKRRLTDQGAKLLTYLFD